MLKLKQIAITGGIACGKSTVCSILRDLGAYVVSADEIVHTLLTPKTSLGKQVIQLLGPEIKKGQELDRKEIAQKVFNDKTLLTQLEQLIHPAVRKEIQNTYARVQQQHSHPLFVAEIPLLYESGRESSYDFVIVVAADPKECRRRFVEKTGYPPEEFDRRMAQQIPLEEKCRKADAVITNDGSEQALYQQIKTLYKQLTCL